MSQVSYGTITITDTNDIEQIYMVYAGSESNITSPDVSDFALWKTDVTQTSGTYIWQRTVVKKSGIEITAMNFQQFYGEPVCVTGDGGRSIKSITTYYCNYGTGTPEENYSGWNIDTPEYDEDKPNYWVKTVIIYVDDSEEEFELNGDIVTFEDGEHKHLTSFAATINPKQDLHGYDKPWVGGAGKNKLHNTANSATVNGVTFTVNSDGTITASGTATVDAQLQINFSGLDGDYYFCGCPSDGGAQKYDVYAWDLTAGARFKQWNGTTQSISDYGTYQLRQIKIPSGHTGRIVCRVFNGATVSGVMFKPMIVQSNVTDSSFEPYENICPISGWDEVSATRSGKNVLNPTLPSGTNAGITATRQSNKSYRLTGTATGIAVNIWIAGNYITNVSTQLDNFKLLYLKAGTVVTFKDCKPYFYDIETGRPNQNYGYSNYPIGSGARAITLPHDVWLTGVRIPDGVVGETYNATIYPQIELGTTATAYEPYQADTYTTDLPETVYGGSLDVVSGVLTVDRAMVDLGTLEWSYDATNKRFGSTSLNTVIKKVESNYDIANAICSQYKTTYLNSIYAQTDNYFVVVSTAGAVSVRDTQYTDAPTFKTAMNGVQLCYELAEPRTIQLTPKQVTTLLGTNNVWSDSGDVSISGFTIVNKDVQIHIDNSLTEALSKAANALEKANEAESIAAHANEDSQGALSIATGINQHFFSIPNDYSTSVPAGSYITEINVDEFKRSPSGGNLLTRSDGVWLRNGADILASLQGTGLTFLIPTGTYKGRKSLEILGGTAPALKLYDAQNNNAVATLNSNGLVLSKGGIRVNTVGSNNGVYISSENLGSKVTSLDGDKINWRAVIGSKFGVDSEGNLYANEAHISGEITASKLTINSNATINDTSGLIRNDAIDIGGRNLVWDTEWKNISMRWTDWGTPTTREIVTLDGKRWLHLVTTANSYQGYSQNWTKRENPTSEIQAGDTIVFSYTAYAETAGQVCTVGCHWNNSSGSIVNQNWFASSLTTTPKRYTSQPFTVPANAVKFNVMIGQGVAQVQDLYITEVKIEKGNKATDWTPAPEDVQSEIDAKKSTHTLSTTYSYTYAQLLTYSNEYTTAWTVSSTADVSVGDTVRLKMTVSDMSNAPVYIIGTVTEIVNATRLKITSHGLDTTVIDGGNILTNSITAQQLNTTNINASKSLTVGAMTTDAQNSILNSKIEVGGRNLMKDTANLGSAWIKDTGASVSNGVATIALGTSSGNYRIYQMPATGYWGKWEANTTYTMSVDAKVSASGIKLSFEPYANGVAHKEVSPTTEWKRYTYTFTSGNSTATASCSLFAKNAISGYLYLRNPKLEYGNKATDWTPAPEDLENVALSRTQRIYYRSDSSTLPNSPTENNKGKWFEPTQSDTGYNTWSRDIVPLIGGFHYLFMCDQTQTAAQHVAGNECTNSSVMRDDSTSVIDGGSITTGRINANYIDAAGLQIGTGQVDGLGDFMSLMTFKDGVLRIAKPGSRFAVELSDDGLFFKQNDTAVSYINMNRLYIPYAVVLDQMMIGKEENNSLWAWTSEEDGSLTLKWIGGNN